MFGLINERGVWVYIHLLYIKINPSQFSKVYHPTIVPMLRPTLIQVFKSILCFDVALHDFVNVVGSTMYPLYKSLIWLKHILRFS
jgi:hypothetical protein